MNKKQRIICLYILGFFLYSIIYIPEKVTAQNGVTVFLGYTFLWDLMFEVDIKILIIEWLVIFVSGVALILNFKEKQIIHS